MSRTATFAVLAWLAGCAPAHPAVVTPAPPSDVVTAVRGTIEQWRQAYEVRSVEGLAKLYAHAPDLAIVQEGVVQLGWDPFEATLRTKLSHATQVRVRMKDVRVIAVGVDAAFAVATMTREISDATTTVTENGSLTLVLRKDAAGWVIVGEHYSYYHLPAVIRGNP